MPWTKRDDNHSSGPKLPQHARTTSSVPGTFVVQVAVILLSCILFSHMSLIEKKNQAPSGSSPIPRVNYAHPTTKTLAVQIIHDIPPRRAIAIDRVRCWRITMSNQSATYNLRATLFELHTIFELNSSSYIQSSS
jgi:hypothetical protein